MCEVEDNRDCCEGCPSAAASAHTTTTTVTIITTSITNTATKAWATISNHSATTTTAFKTKDIKAKNLGFIETVGSKFGTHYACTGCQADISESL